MAGTAHQYQFVQLLGRQTRVPQDLLDGGRQPFEQPAALADEPFIGDGQRGVNVVEGHHHHGHGLGGQGDFARLRLPDQLQPVHPGHLHVGEQDVRPSCFLQLFQRLQPVSRLRYLQGKPGFRDQEAHTFSFRLFIVYHQNAIHVLFFLRHFVHG